MSAIETRVISLRLVQISKKEQGTQKCTEICKCLDQDPRNFPLSFLTIIFSFLSVANSINENEIWRLSILFGFNRTFDYVMRTWDWYEQQIFGRRRGHAFCFEKMLQNHRCALTTTTNWGFPRVPAAYDYIGTWKLRSWRGHDVDASLSFTMLGKTVILYQG